MLTFPHFGDQGYNARSIIDQGAGIALFDPSMADNRAGSNEYFKFDEPLFNSDDILNKFLKLLTDDSYAESIGRMKVAAVAAGGAVKAELEIRNYYISSMLLK